MGDIPSIRILSVYKFAINLQALHITDVLHKSVTDLKLKIEDNAKTRVLTDKQLTRMIVELDDVSWVTLRENLLLGF